MFSSPLCPLLWPATLTTLSTCSHFYLLSMILGSRAPSQFLLSGKFTKSAYFLLSSNLFSQHTLIRCHEKIKDSWKMPELAQSSSCLLFQLPLQHLSQPRLTSFPKPTQQVARAALCHSPLPSPKACWRGCEGASG